MAPLKSFFKQIDMFCTECKLSDEESEKERRTELQGLVQGALGELISSCENEETRKVAKAALEKCQGCNYAQPEAHDYLDSIRVI